MTLHSRCTPIGGHRCWQYRKASIDLPTWLCAYVILQTSGKMEFQYPNNGHCLTLKDTDWIVLFDFEGECVMHYTDEEFRKQFETVD